MQKKLLIDYLTFTVARSDFFSLDDDEQDILPLILLRFQLEGLNFVERRAFYGYNCVYVADGVSVCFGGREDICIQLSGSGCRAFESLHPDLSWEEYISYLFGYNSLSVARLDIACDTFGLLKLSVIQRYTLDRHFVSRWRTYLCMIGNRESSVVFGSPKSDFRLRIYDKSLERQQNVKGVEVPKNWVRVEMQMRDAQAESFLRAWRAAGDLGSVFFGLLRNQLMYWKSYDGKNRDRMEVARWWDKLLDGADRLTLASVVGREYNLEGLTKYVVSQAGRSIQTYVSIYGVDQLRRSVSQLPLTDAQRALIASADVVDAPWD